MITRHLLVWSLLALSAPPQATASEAHDAAPLDLIFPTFFASPEGWRGMQSIQADGKGRAFLLRTETMEEFPLDSGGQFGDPKTIQTPGVEPPRDVRIAVMGEERGEWFLFGHEAVLISDHRDLPIARTPGMPFQAAMIDGDPYLLMSPLQATKDEDRPMIVKWTGVDWDVVAMKTVDPNWTPMEGWQQWGALLIPGDSNELWLAYIDQPKVERYHSRTGKLETEVVLNPEADFRRSEESIAKARAQMESKQIATDPSRKVVKRQVEVAVTRTVHHGAALAPDGIFYLLASDEEDPDLRLLRRWNPLTQTLEEVAVAFDVSGLATMAFGEDGLHIAQFDVLRGRAFIDHETLDAAAWRPVQGVLVDGVSLDAPNEDGVDDEALESASGERD